MIDVTQGTAVLANTAWVYVGLGWGASAGALFGYAALVIIRGRRLSREVPVEDRRWS